MRRAAILLLILIAACAQKEKPAAAPKPAVKKYSAADVPRFLQNLGDAKLAVDAANALGDIGDKRAVEPLTAILRRKHTKDGEDLQKAAGVALGKIGAVDTLLAALDDKDEFVRTFAAAGLGESKDTRAIPALARHLGDEVGDSPGLQFEIGAALNKIGPKGVDAVLAAAKSPDERVRDAATNALGNSSDPRAQPALLQMLHDESISVRRSVGFFLSYMSVTPASHKYMAEALQKKDWMVIQAAMPYYVQRGIAGSEPTLIEAMDRTDGDMMIGEMFLNSGNSALKACAMKWAEKNGWKVQKETNENTIHQRWGSGQ